VLLDCNKINILIINKIDRKILIILVILKIFLKELSFSLVDDLNNTMNNKNKKTGVNVLMSKLKEG
jgi:hypothetical protein